MKKAILFIYIDIGEIVKCTENSYVTLLLAIISTTILILILSITLDRL